jgi:hypothetical protein
VVKTEVRVLAAVLGGVLGACFWARVRAIGLCWRRGIGRRECGELWTSANTMALVVVIAARAASESCCREYQRPCVLKSRCRCRCRCRSKSKSKSIAMAGNRSRKRTTHHGEAGLE